MHVRLAEARVPSYQRDGTANPFRKESFNLTRQAELYQTNRESYTKLKAEAAGVK
jgi:hypothetical protein